MQDHVNKRVWLVGAGQMACDYTAVLKDMATELTVIGRGKKKSEIFASKTGITPHIGGVEEFLAENTEPAEYAIVATDIMSLDSVAMSLVDAGVTNIMVEKPGGLSRKALEGLKIAAISRGCNISIAYNRRFYSSVRTLAEMVKAEGGVTSCLFEFSEFSDVVSQLEVEDVVKQHWFLANSTHVVDLVFSVIGLPAELTAHSSGGLEWHSRASIFVGAGVSEHTVPFAWHANWDGPGRWGIEFVTSKNRYYLRPLEMLHRMEHGTFTVDAVNIDNTLDLKYKPGLFQQVACFLSGEQSYLCDLNQHLKHWDFYMKMAGYIKN